MDRDSFWALRDRPLHVIEPADWGAYYAEIVAWLDCEDADIRGQALERLTMAVFRAERSALWGREDRLDVVRARTRWFLDVLEDAQRRHADLIPGFLKALRYHGDDEPFPEVLLPWLRALEAKPDPQVREDLVEGGLILIGGYGTNREAGEAHWLARLDHPSTWIRGCAARMLGAWSNPDDDEVGTAVLDLVLAKELERPGIAGPFWSGWEADVATLPFDPVEWMLDIVERRNGPEPDGMPFNGIDFHLHELAGDSVEAVNRLLVGGRAGLALAAATEMACVVEGMREPLRMLGDDADGEIALCAQQHLALVYNELHPKADPSRLRRIEGWLPGVDAFVMRQGNAEVWRDVAVFYPAAGATFDDAKAWQIVDAAAPPSVRGELARHFLAAHDEPPGPYRFGDSEDRAYASGAIVSFEGDVETRRWERVSIVGRGLQKSWAPLQWTGPSA